MKNYTEVPEGYEVVKFELENDDQVYYVVVEEGDQNAMIEFASGENAEVRTWSIEVNGIPSACLPISSINPKIYIDYSEPPTKDIPQGWVTL